MNIVDTLVATKAVIANPKDWCKHIRTNALGQHCALGAFEVATGLPYEGNVDDHPAVTALAVVARQLDPQMPGFGYGAGPWDVANFNNTHSHAELMHAFDLTIADEKAKRSLLRLKAKLKKSAKEDELV